jgi:hypothetical protein
MAGEIASFLKEEDPKALGILAQGIDRAIKSSFETSHVMVFKTAAEVRRRTQICVEAARLLRRELGWSVYRIADSLPRVLRAKLDGASWDPENESAFWRPEAEQPRLGEGLESDPDRSL